MDDVALLGILDEAVVAIRDALGDVTDWGLYAEGAHPGQHHSDVAADAAAVAVLTGAGLGVLSEESGRHHATRPVTVVVDPLDGSTNASRGVPWYAASLCAVDTDGPVAAVVANLASGVTYRAVRGGGATRDGDAIHPSATTSVNRSLLALSGYPPEYFGWYQFRSLGASALDLCLVADGTVDGFVDCSTSAHGPWDYLGASLICRESGAVVADAAGRDLVVLGHDDRRTPVAAATQELLDGLLAARAAFEF